MKGSNRNYIQEELLSLDLFWIMGLNIKIIHITGKIEIKNNFDKLYCNLLVKYLFFRFI